MRPKQEALRVIREQVGDRSVTFNTTITELSEEFDTDILDLVDALESEFGVELSEELLVDVETIGELCQVVVRATREINGTEDDEE